MSVLSAVAPAPNISSVADPVLELAHAVPTVHQIEAAEMNRWMIWFGTPALVCAIFVAVTLGTGDELWIGAALAAFIVDIFVLVWLAFSSDTNGMIGEVAHH
jgi:hypothetical protein